MRSSNSQRHTSRSHPHCRGVPRKASLQSKVLSLKSLLLMICSKLFSAPKFNKKDQKRYFIGFLFFIWLGFAIVLFALSILDDQCGRMNQNGLTNQHSYHGETFRLVGPYQSISYICMVFYRSGIVLLSNPNLR